MREFIPKAGTPLSRMHIPVTRNTGSLNPQTIFLLSTQQCREAQSHIQGPHTLSLFLNLQLVRWASVPLPLHMDRTTESYNGGFFP